MKMANSHEPVLRARPVIYSDLLPYLIQDFLSNPPDPRRFIDLLVITTVRNRIDTVGRLCYFLAQILHESGEFKYFEELATGEQYEGRTDLGNTQAGDGRRFKGRGLIQLTGRDNYARYNRDINDPKLDIITNPELLAQYPLAVFSAGWYWRVNGLNRYADRCDFKGLTRAVNGGLNGFDTRQNYLIRLQNRLDRYPLVYEA